MSIGLGHHIRRAAQRHPGKAALLDHGEVFSYAEFHQRTDRLANALLALSLTCRRSSPHGSRRSSGRGRSMCCPRYRRTRLGKIAKSQLREPFWQETGRLV